MLMGVHAGAKNRIDSGLIFLPCPPEPDCQTYFSSSYQCASSDIGNIFIYFIIDI